jgi:hypothetical protein
MHTQGINRKGMTDPQTYYNGFKLLFQTVTSRNHAAITAFEKVILKALTHMILNVRQHLKY